MDYKIKSDLHLFTANIKLVKVLCRLSEYLCRPIDSWNTPTQSIFSSAGTAAEMGGVREDRAAAVRLAARQHRTDVKSRPTEISPWTQGIKLTSNSRKELK